MYFSSHLKGPAKGRKDEHEVENRINPQRRGNVRELTAWSSFQFAFPIKLFYRQIVTNLLFNRGSCDLTKYCVKI